MKNLLSLAWRIRNDSRFSRKKNLTVIDDLESFKTFLKVSDISFLQNLILSKDKTEYVLDYIGRYLGRDFWDKVTIVEQRELVKALEIENPSMCAIIRINDDLDQFSQDFLDSVIRSKVCIALDSIQNPWNLGGIFRTNSAFEIFNVILLGNCVFPFNPRVIRASKGYVFEQKIKVMNLDQFVSFINKIDHDIYFLETEGENMTNFLHGNSSTKIFVFGNEEKGINQILKRTIRNYKSVRIDIRIDSLNVFSTHSIVSFLIRNYLF